jgi:hypothetical protein
MTSVGYSLTAQPIRVRTRGVAEMTSQGREPRHAANVGAGWVGSVRHVDDKMARLIPERNRDERHYLLFDGPQLLNTIAPLANKVLASLPSQPVRLYCPLRPRCRQ